MDKYIVFTVLSLVNVFYIYTVAKCWDDEQNRVVLNPNDPTEGPDFTSHVVRKHCYGNKTCEDEPRDNRAGKNWVERKIVHKCCPLKMVYDPSWKVCRPVEKDEFSRLSIGGEYKVMFYESLPYCDGFFVDNLYENVKIGDDLVGYTRNVEKTYNLDDICVDKTIDNTFVVRSCETVNVCEKILCVRKCCQFGYGYAQVETEEEIQMGCYRGYYDYLDIKKYKTNGNLRWLYEHDITDENFPMDVNYAITYGMNCIDFPYLKEQAKKKKSHYGLEYIDSVLSRRLYCIENVYNSPEYENGSSMVYYCDRRPAEDTDVYANEYITIEKKNVDPWAFLSFIMWLITPPFLCSWCFVWSFFSDVKFG